MKQLRTLALTYLSQKLLDPLVEPVAIKYAYLPLLAMFASPPLLYTQAQKAFAILPKEAPIWLFLLFLFPLLISIIALNRKNKKLSINEHKYFTCNDDSDIPIGVTVPAIITPQGGYCVSEDILCENHKTTLIHLQNSTDHACRCHNCNTILKGKDRQFTFIGADRAVRSYIRKKLKTEPYELDIYSVEGDRLLPPWHKDSS